MDVGTFVAACATVIAVASLTVSIYQLRATRIHNRHSLRPVLHLHVVFQQGELCGISVMNSGLGPAVITETCAWVDGKEIGPWLRQTAGLARDGIAGPRPFANTLVAGSVVPAGHREYLLSMDAYDRRQHSSFADFIERRFDVEIRYESLYGGDDFVVSTRAPGWRSSIRPGGKSVPEVGG